VRYSAVRSTSIVAPDERVDPVTITSSTDFPLTGVVFVTGDTAIEDAQVAGHRGRIAIKNARRVPDD